MFYSWLSRNQESQSKLEHTYPTISIFFEDYVRILTYSTLHFSVRSIHFWQFLTLMKYRYGLIYTIIASQVKTGNDVKSYSVTMYGLPCAAQ